MWFFKLGNIGEYLYVILIMNYNINDDKHHMILLDKFI